MKLNKKAQAGIFSNIVVLVIFLVVVSVAGLLAGLIYYDMNILDSTLRTVNFDIPVTPSGANLTYNVTDFQDILNIVVYPILGLKDSLPYLTYFLVFTFILALGMTAYLTTKNPIFFVLHLLFTILLTYFSIILSKSYIQLMSNPFINSLMINFTIYNKIMFYLPQIVFFTALVFGTIAFIGVLKPNNGTATGINYGGEY